MNWSWDLMPSEEDLTGARMFHALAAVLGGFLLVIFGAFPRLPLLLMLATGLAAFVTAWYGSRLGILAVFAAATMPHYFWRGLPTPSVYWVVSMVWTASACLRNVPIVAGLTKTRGEFLITRPLPGRDQNPESWANWFWQLSAATAVISFCWLFVTVVARVCAVEFGAGSRLLRAGNAAVWVLGIMLSLWFVTQIALTLRWGLRSSPAQARMLLFRELYRGLRSELISLGRALARRS